eukprot:3655692-Pyramimonas_sp.AAC.1
MKASSVGIPTLKKEAAELQIVECEENPGADSVKQLLSCQKRIPESPSRSVPVLPFIGCVSYVKSCLRSDASHGFKEALLLVGLRDKHVASI